MNITQFTIEQDPLVPAKAPGPHVLALLKKAGVNLVWRFYRGPDRRWRWQHLTSEGTVIAESTGSYTSYDECRADAQGKGYVFH